VTHIETGAGFSQLGLCPMVEQVTVDVHLQYKRAGVGGYNVGKQQGYGLLTRCHPGVYHPSVRTEVLLPPGASALKVSGGVTKVPQQHALRFDQNWHPAH
jgi:hypothetical protein